MHLTVSKVLPGEKLLNSHLADLGLIFTSLVPPCRVDLELICYCNLLSKKGCEFFCLCRYLMYNGAGRIANAVDDNVPKSFARSFIDTSCIDNIS